MEKSQLFNKIESLRPLVDAMVTHTPIKITLEDIQSMREIYAVILPGQRLSTGCLDCLRYALVYIWAYWERERPKYDAELAALVVEVVEVVKKPVKRIAKKVVKKPVKRTIKK